MASTVIPVRNRMRKPTGYSTLRPGFALRQQPGNDFRIAIGLVPAIMVQIRVFRVCDVAAPARGHEYGKHVRLHRSPQPRAVREAP